MWRQGKTDGNCRDGFFWWLTLNISLSISNLSKSNLLSILYLALYPIFICHAGWHADCYKRDDYGQYMLDNNGNKVKISAECAKLFVNKFYAIGNVHLSYWFIVYVCDEK